MRYLILALITVLAVGLVACGGKSDSDKASDALNTGLQAHLAGDLTAAAAAYRETLALDPQNKYAYFNLGLIDQTNGNSQGAESNYRTALGIDPDYSPALFNLAIVRNDLNDVQGAIELYRKVTTLSPDNAGAHLNLGLALRRIGQTQEGDAELATAVRLDPSLQGRFPSSTPKPEPSTTPTPTL